MPIPRGWEGEWTFFHPREANSPEIRLTAAPQPETELRHLRLLPWKVPMAAALHRLLLARGQPSVTSTGTEVS